MVDNTVIYLISVISFVSETLFSKNGINEVIFLDDNEILMIEQ